MREMTEVEKRFWYVYGQWPCGHGSEYVRGPRGGASLNVICPACGLRMNVLDPAYGVRDPFMGQVIFEPPGYTPPLS